MLKIVKNDLVLFEKIKLFLYNHNRKNATDRVKVSDKSLNNK